VSLAQGAGLVFGYRGGAVLPLYNALLRYPIRHLLARHEQNAADAADGFARATGRSGVCIETSGPGATNLVSGLAATRMNSVPLVALTGQVAPSVLETLAFTATLSTSE
jgi:acetolactate synthase I/II/III large subunit